MSPEKFTAFVTLTTLVSFLPGPAVIFVMSQAAWRGPRAGVSAGLGIQSANAIYFALSGFGLASLIAASGTAFTVIKLVGAAYLAWLGITAFVQSFRKQQETTALTAKASRSGFRDGLFVALGNPKGILYFVALLPQFLDPAQPLWRQIALLGIIAIGIDFAADVAYAFVGGAVSRVLNRPKVRRWFERGIGSLFVGLSAVTALYRRVA
ncbi:MAG: LysE family translocator [Alphaproteobacteria bacterium]